MARVHGQNKTRPRLPRSLRGLFDEATCERYVGGHRWRRTHPTMADRRVYLYRGENGVYSLVFYKYWTRRVELPNPSVEELTSAVVTWQLTGEEPNPLV